MQRGAYHLQLWAPMWCRARAPRPPGREMQPGAAPPGALACRRAAAWRGRRGEHRRGAGTSSSALGWESKVSGSTIHKVTFIFYLFFLIMYVFPFFFNFYLFMIVTERERERGRHTGKGRSRLHAPGARCGIRSQVSRIMPWAEGRC